MKIISEIDKKNYVKIRENIKNFINRLSEKYDSKDTLIMDIAPEIHMGTKEFFKHSTIKTLDIDPNSGADYILDLCENNKDTIKDETFDLIVCTEVLEHVNDPFFVVSELRRMLKIGGVVAISTPFNFRIHGPLPDNWRFTIYGLNVLFKDFEILTLESLDDSDRDLMPIQYTLIAKKYGQ
jgi:SAM-dependent methyltransferase